MRTYQLCEMPTKNGAHRTRSHILQGHSQVPTLNKCRHLYSEIVLLHQIPSRAVQQCTQNHRVTMCKSKMQIFQAKQQIKYFAASQGFRESSANETSTVLWEEQQFRHSWRTLLSCAWHHKKLPPRDPSADITDRAKQCVVHHTCRCAILIVPTPTKHSSRSTGSKQEWENAHITSTTRNTWKVQAVARVWQHSKVVKIKLSKEVRTVDL